jgi:predicted glycosyltransferase
MPMLRRLIDTLAARGRRGRRMRGRVLFYVQSLLGVGHLRRASLLARALADEGLDVAVVLGATPPPGIGFEGCARVLLPPVRAADARFEVLLDEHGQPIDDAWRDRRQARLLMEFEAFRPDLVLIELFPFGRRPFRFELMPLLVAAATRTPRAKVVCSVRDIVVRKSNPARPDSARDEEIATLIDGYFDRVLVHGDPALVPFEASFPAARRIAGKLAYTGYVAPAGVSARIAARRADGRGEVIVSVGGGAVGEPLLRAALAARPLSAARDRVFRLITGPNLPAAVFEDLAWNPPPGVIVERWRPDLPVLLRNATLSVSQAGYNTLMDVLTAGLPAVVVPFATDGETEQRARAHAFAARGAVTLVEPADLAPQTLAAAIDKALTTRPRRPPIRIDGARTTARLLATMCRAGTAA